MEDSGRTWRCFKPHQTVIIECFDPEKRKEKEDGKLTQ
jgi:hypothetical protein